MRKMEIRSCCHSVCGMMGFWRFRLESYVGAFFGDMQGTEEFWKWKSCVIVMSFEGKKLVRKISLDPEIWKK